ncbi:MAG: hypothetical protein WD382_03770 [Halofilum sp. (in: g-proteobacteria)]
MIAAGSFTIESDHPALAGHFPGDPVVPGCVLLDHALALVRRVHAMPATGALPRVKFTAVVRPGEPVEVQAEQRGGHVAFRGTVEGAPVIEGQWATAADDPGAGKS